MDYRNGKIYRLVCNKTGFVYYGSTTQPLHKRKWGHKQAYRKHCDGTYHYVSSFEIVKHDDFSMVLVERFPCETKEELHARERFFIENNECVNRLVPGRSIQEYNKYYRENNKEMVKKHRKLYKERHREEIALRSHHYYESVKDFLNQKQDCACGGKYSKHHIQTHKRTQKHQKYLQSLKNDVATT